MPALSNPHHFQQKRSGEKTAPQKVSIISGVALIFVGIIGTIVPAFLDMHLSLIHNALYIVSGIIGLWSGLSGSNKSFYFCLGFGTGYGLLGIAGFVLGQPGYPVVGNLEADQNLFRLIPNVLELGSVDHIVHILISAFLVFTVYSIKRI